MRSPIFLINGKTATEPSSFRSLKSLQVVLDEEEEQAAVVEKDPLELAGILYKWVNFGKGWRPRWFLLKDGVFSYYKVHGPDKITFRSNEQAIASCVVGDHSVRYWKKHRNPIGDECKISGELHLQVSSIRKSKTDDKKFYIYTGTKTLNLRALTREDRNVWLDSLLAAKELFSKFPVPHGLILQFEEKTIPTNKLRSRLVEEGVDDTVVAECENIMKSEFVELQKQVKYLQRNYLGLVEKLRLIEAEKIELEATVVDQHLHDGDHSTIFGQERDGSIMDFDEDMDKHGTETDEDDDVYFDTKEMFSHLRKNHSDSPGNLSDFDDASPKTNRISSSSSIDLVASSYPYVKRRERLPEPKEKEKETSLWSLIKGNIGTDLTRVCLPVSFNEPISSLQKCFEDLEYSHLLDRAYEWGKQGNSLLRLLNVAAFAVSGYASTEDRTCKPFNPLLGETYEADFPDKGVKFFSEKVSHHPMVVACHCDGSGWKFYGDSTVRSKFWGQSIQLDPVGILTLEFDDGEIFQWSKVTTSIYNLILGKVYCDHYGTMRIQGNRDLSCRLKFKEQSIMDRNPHQVQGFVHDKKGQKIASLLGKWDESMYYIEGDVSRKPKGYDPMSEAVLLWEKNKPAKFSTKYNLTSFAITLNEITPGLEEVLPPTDSRLRPDQRLLENGEYEKAFAEKQRLEEKQRMARKQQESGWKPQWFRKDKDTGTYRYIGGYWEARSKRQWDSCLDIFGSLEIPEQSI